MRKLVLFAVLALFLLPCGCKSEIKQEKAVIVPYSINENISYRKETLNINGIKLSSPKQIASNGDTLFVCDSGNSRIVKCDTFGNSVAEIGQIGTLPGEFVEPICITVSQTQICVYDRGSSRIQVLTVDGKPVWEFYLEDEFNFHSEITNVEMDADGAVYFSLLAFDNHTGSSGIYYLPKDGKPQQIIAYAVGALRNSGDKIYYMSKYELLENNTWITGYAELLSIVNRKYKRVSAFSDGFSAVGLEFFNDRLYVYDSCSQSVNAFYPTGEYIETVFSEPVVNDFSYGGFCGDNNENFYLCDAKNDAVYKLVKND